ncbi:MAG: hypothetical protein CL726_10790, partial [Chloroflexi bacterium]|nr:hypothetical protein [Chloroflexota bacterium]
DAANPDGTAIIPIPIITIFVMPNKCIVLSERSVSVLMAKKTVGQMISREITASKILPGTVFLIFDDLLGCWYPLKPLRI